MKASKDIEKIMSYILKHKDKPLIKFDFKSSAVDGLSTEIIHIYDTHQKFLPIGIDFTNHVLLEWLETRTIPKNRKFVHKTLRALGLNVDDTKGIIDISKGLSLNDCYWIVKEDFQGTFLENNLYDHTFDTQLAWLAYTGYGEVKHKAFISSPEFSTNGMLAKAWRRIKNRESGEIEIVLYKAGSEACANCGKEPYSEFYAYQIAKQMGLDATAYTLGKWKGNLNSVCTLFTSKALSFVPIYRIVKSSKWGDVLQYYRELGDDYYEALLDMIVFDAIICNVDRHFGNFGLMVENETNQIIKTAPIFDNGLSLFYNDMDDELNEIEKLSKEKLMKNSGDFIAFVKEVITEKQKKKVRRLINFKFEPHYRYKLVNKRRLKKIEAFIQHRVQEILSLESR